MRRILALGCCVLHVAFGLVVAPAHVHGSADHHAESRGLHLDHDHLEPPEPGHRHEHPHAPVSPVRGDRFGARHADHHEGDAVYVNATAARASDAGKRIPDAVVPVAATISALPSMPTRDDASTRPPRDRHDRRSAHPRAPPI